ncbi:MAG: BamA/TamA family outer membrane protein [Chitinivibrionales bacterium]|nr:BamA/TamA family outer membrane protein [Chitinivibrionales bacterium]
MTRWQSAAKVLVLVVTAILPIATNAGNSSRIIHQDSLRSYLLHDSDQLLKPISRLINKTNSIAGLPVWLDSLGYFEAVYDTLTPDTVVIHSGPRFVIDSPVVTGTKLHVALDSLIPYTMPCAFDAALINALGWNILAWFGEQGYPFAQMSLNLNKASSQVRHAVRPLFKISAGKKCVFGAPVFSGNEKTHRQLLLYDISFNHGELYRTRKIQQTIRKLKSRSYIADASPGAPVLSRSSFPDSLFGGEEKTDASIAAHQVLAPITIAENTGLGVDGALAYQSSQNGEPRLVGLINLSLLNVFGWGESGDMQFQGEDSLLLFSIDINKPWLLGYPLFASTGFGMEIREEQHGYLEGAAELLYEIRPLWQTGIRLRGYEVTLPQTLYDSTGTAAATTQEERRYTGGSFIFKRLAERLQRGAFARRVTIETGAGIADSAGTRFSRWSLELDAGIHVPFRMRHAVYAKLVSKNLITRQEDLADVELFRVGGFESVRGYADYQFPLRTVAFIQLEYIFYFARTGSIYLFGDAGTGFRKSVSLQSENRVDLFGFGLGIRIPSRLGMLSLEWARNYEETRGFGRIHVRISNALSSNRWN